MTTALAWIALIIALGAAARWHRMLAPDEHMSRRWLDAHHGPDNPTRHQ